MYICNKKNSLLIFSETRAVVIGVGKDHRGVDRGRVRGWGSAGIG